MNAYFTFSSLAFMLLTLSACVRPDPLPWPDVYGVSWQLVDASSADLGFATRGHHTIRFSTDERVAGVTADQVYFGTYSQSPDQSLRFGILGLSAQPRSHHHDAPPATATGRVPLLRALSQVDGYRLSENRLTLTAAGRTLLRFEPTPQAAQ